MSVQIKVLAPTHTIRRVKLKPIQLQLRPAMILKVAFSLLLYSSIFCPVDFYHIISAALRLVGVVPVKPAAGDEEEEEVRDLFGSDNEDVKAPGHSNFLISGPPLVTELAARFSWAKLSPQYLLSRIS